MSSSHFPKSQAPTRRNMRTISEPFDAVSAEVIRPAFDDRPTWKPPVKPGLAEPLDAIREQMAADLSVDPRYDPT